MPDHDDRRARNNARDEPTGIAQPSHQGEPMPEPFTQPSAPVHLALTIRDAGFCVEHLRLVVERERATTADHAEANLSARWLADRIEAALDGQRKEPDA